MSVNVKKKIYIFIGFVIFLTAIFGIKFSMENFSSEKNSKPREIINILETHNHNEQVAYYRELLERVGIREAQEYLYNSGLPFTGDTHLLNHTAGDFAYEKYGNKAVLHCSDYFLSSCYHGAILKTIGKEGTDGLEKTMEACWEKGITVASQCAHGIGHGSLAWVGYKNLTKALEICDSLEKKDSRFPLFNCHDGVFMENLWAVHDGRPSPDRWIKNDDPYYPCSDPQIKDEWQRGCWSNQASVMYQMFQGDYKKVAEYCDAVTDESHKETCYDNIFRQIHPSTESNLDKTLYFCGLLPKEKTTECLLTISNSDYSVGGRRLSFQICSELAERKEDCYKSLYSNIKLYYREPKERNDQCMFIEEESFRTECMNIVSIQNN